MPYYDGRPVEDVDYYYGHRSTDITRRHEIQVPSHAGHPSVKNAPQPYFVLPYHDLTDKFRKRLRDWGRMVTGNSYHGRRVTEITDPARIPGNWKGAFLGPYPPSSQRIGDPNFTRYEYMHPVGRKKPGPMDDYVPMRDRYGRVVRAPSPPETPGRARRRLLGLPPEGCHRKCPSRPRTPENRRGQCEGQDCPNPREHHYRGEREQFSPGEPHFHYENRPKLSNNDYPLDEFQHTKPTGSSNRQIRGEESSMAPDFIDCQRSKSGGQRRNIRNDGHDGHDIHSNNQPDDYSRHQRREDCASKLQRPSDMPAKAKLEYERPPILVDGFGHVVHKDTRHRQPVGGRARRYDNEDFKPDYGRPGDNNDSFPRTRPPKRVAQQKYDDAYADDAYGHPVGAHSARSHHEQQESRPCRPYNDEPSPDCNPSHFHSRLRAERRDLSDGRLQIGGPSYQYKSSHCHSKDHQEDDQLKRLSKGNYARYEPCVLSQRSSGGRRRYERECDNEREHTWSSGEPRRYEIECDSERERRSDPCDSTSNSPASQIDPSVNPKSFCSIDKMTRAE